MDHVHTSRTEDEASLEATIIERLGVHVEVKDVVHSTGLVMVSIHFPELQTPSYWRGRSGCRRSCGHSQPSSQMVWC